MTKARTYVLAAGGTGGHMVPAAALGAELASRGHHVVLVSDDRGVRFPGLFEDVVTHVLPAGRLGGGPLGWFRAAGKMMAGRSMALKLYKEIEPSCVIGFGGLEDVRFRGVCRPGDRFVIVSRLLKLRRSIMTCEFQCFVGQNMVCEGILKGVSLPLDLITGGDLHE